MKPKYALIIDGNYILNKNVFSLDRMKSLYGGLPLSLVANFKKYIDMQGFEKIFFVSDSRKPSWRKELLSEYKGKRHKSGDIDWNYVYDTYATFKQTLVDENKAIVLERDHIEGDDWIGVLIKKLNAKNIGALTISADHDLFQFIKYSNSNNYINLQVDDKNGNETLFAPEGYLRFLSKFDSVDECSNDLFNLELNESFDILTLTSKYDVVEVDNEKELFKKIIEGDKKSDNIPSIYSYPKVMKNGETRIMGIGDATGDKMYELFINDGKQVNLNSHIPITPDVIDYYEKVKNKEFSDEEKKRVVNGLIRNIRMIYLHHKHIPDNLKEFIIIKLLL